MLNRRSGEEGRLGKLTHPLLIQFESLLISRRLMGSRHLHAEGLLTSQILREYGNVVPLPTLIAALIMKLLLQ